MAPAFDVQAVLSSLPHFDTFCSVARIEALVEELRGRPEFTIELAGESRFGRPIHHVTIGSGTVKALWVAWPHANEPIGGLTVFSLLTLLSQAHPELLRADVEWHVVPCIDPDGALLNEGWTQRPFGLESYLRSFHIQDLSQQVEMTFPIAYKRLEFDRPTKETLVYKELLDRVRPDLLCSLHNASVGGGVWYGSSREIAQSTQLALRGLLEGLGLRLKEQPPWSGFGLAEYGPGVIELVTTRKRYDHLEAFSPEPEQVIHWGTSSWDYLSQLGPDSLSFVAEIPYARHPADGSSTATSHNLRQLRLRLDADNLFVASVILEEWDRVHDDLDSASPFYEKIESGVVALREGLLERPPFAPRTIRDSLLNPAYARNATEGEWFSLWFERFYILCQGHEFVRLLESSDQTPAVRGALGRTVPVFEAALAEVSEAIGEDRLEPIPLDALAAAQLGSTLIVLDALVAAR